MASQEKNNVSTTFHDRQEEEIDCVEIPGNGFTLPGERKPKISNEISITESLISTCQPERASSTKKKNNSNRNRKWLVLVAGFYVNICNGFAFGMAALNAAFLTEFGRSKAETAAVQSFTIGMFLIAGVVIGPIVSKYGTRKVGIAAGVLAGLGPSISYFATSIPFLVVTLGMITGLGLSASFIVAGTSCGEYFDGKARLLALSFVSFGSGCGSILYTYILDFLIRQFGWRGCLLIVGAQMMNMIPCLVMCKPRYVGALKPKLIEGERDGSRNNTLRNCCKWFTLKERKLNNRSSLSGVPLNRKNIIGAKFKTIFRNKAFVFFTLTLIVAFPSIVSWTIFLMNFLQMKDFDHSQALSLFICLNIFSAIFKLSPGVLNYIPHLSVMLIPALFTSIGAISCALLPFASSYTHHIVMLGCFGMARGGITTCISVTTMKLVGRELYSTGIGIIFTAVGISMLSAGPIAGYLRDVSESYDLVLFVSSGGLVLSTCLCVCAAILRKWERTHSEKPCRDYNI